MEFKESVAKALGCNPELASVLAQRFQVWPKVVRLWALGVAVPHPKLQRMVLEFIQEYGGTV